MYYIILGVQIKHSKLFMPLNKKSPVRINKKAAIIGNPVIIDNNIFIFTVLWDESTNVVMRQTLFLIILGHNISGKEYTKTALPILRNPEDINVNCDYSLTDLMITFLKITIATRYDILL